MQALSLKMKVGHASKGLEDQVNFKQIGYPEDTFLAKALPPRSSHFSTGAIFSGFQFVT